MKRALLILCILSLGISSQVYGADAQSESAKEQSQTEQSTKDENSKDDPVLPSIFIWSLPDDVTSQSEEEPSDTDDATADSSGQGTTSASEEDDEIVLEPDNITAKGYLEYVEDADAIFLKDDNQELVLNLRVPQKFDTMKATDGKALPKTTFAQNVYARSGDIAYNIAPVDTGTMFKQGNFSVGTSYNESISTSDLGFTTSFYTKYDRKYFSLSSAYNKEAGVAFSTVIDKLSFTPELKLNKYISIKDVLTSDITRNRKQNSLILSISPTKDDRVRFEFGAGQTFDENREMIKSEVKFSTQFKW